MASPNGMKQLSAVLCFSKLIPDHCEGWDFPLLQSPKHRHICRCLRRLFSLLILPISHRMSLDHRNVRQNGIFPVEWLDSRSLSLILTIHRQALDYPKKMKRDIGINHLFLFLSKWKIFTIFSASIVTPSSSSSLLAEMVTRHVDSIATSSRVLNRQRFILRMMEKKYCEIWTVSWKNVLFFIEMSDRN